MARGSGDRFLARGRQHVGLSCVYSCSCGRSSQSICDAHRHAVPRNRSVPAGLVSDSDASCRCSSEKACHAFFRSLPLGLQSRVLRWVIRMSRRPYHLLYLSRTTSYIRTKCVIYVSFHSDPLLLQLLPSCSCPSCTPIRSPHPCLTPGFASSRPRAPPRACPASCRK